MSSMNEVRSTELKLILAVNLAVNINKVRDYCLSLICVGMIPQLNINKLLTCETRIANLLLFSNSDNVVLYQSLFGCCCCRHYRQVNM